jgi:ATP-dependent Clp protease protease subunit
MKKLLNLLQSNAKRGSFRAEDNTIYLYDVIVASDADAEWFGGVSAEAFVKALAGMTGDVALHINSPGGDVFAGVAMAQAIRAYDGKITAHVDGLAASAASAVAVACDDSIMAPGSMMMIHNAWTIALGDRHDFMDTAALLEKIDGDLAKAYAKRAGGEPAAFSAMMDKETWLTADETVELGLANSIAPEKSVENLAKFDLSAFAAAPTAEDTATLKISVDSSAILAAVEDEVEKVLGVFGSAVKALGDEAAAIENAEHRSRLLAARLLQPAA